MNRKKKLYLSGYEGESIEEFVIKLKRNKITHLADVRELPLSRKNGFSRNTLEDFLSKVGIKYTHIKSLGTPKYLRDELKQDGDYITFFNKYRTFIKNKHFELQKLINLTQSETVCIMCFEKDCELCHRTIVADEMLKLKPALQTLAF